MLSFLYSPALTSIHDYWKNHSFDHTDFVSKVMSLLFNTPLRFVIAFCPRSKRLLISWLQSPSAVNLEPTKIKFFQCPIFLSFHIVRGVLKARILKWFAIPFSSGPHSVRPESKLSFKSQTLILLHQKANRMKPKSQKTNQSDHMDHSLS